MTFAQKSSIALAASIFTFVLSFIGFEANAVQTEETIKSMKSVMTLIPLLGVATSVFIIYQYPIDSRAHKELLESLEEG